MVAIDDVLMSKQLSARINYREMLYERLFETVPVGAFCTDPAGNFLDANPAMFRMLGHPEDYPLNGNNSSGSYVNPEDRRRWQAEVKKNDSVQGFETRFRRADGSTFWVALSVSAVRDPDGEISFYQGIAEDIDDQKRAQVGAVAGRRWQEEALQYSLAKYKTLFESAGDGIFIIYEGRIIECNPRALAMLRGSREQIINRSPLDFTLPLQPDGSPSKDKGSEKMELILDGAPQFFEWQCRRLDGSVFDSEISLSRMDLEGGGYIMALMRDITKRKRAEAALRRSEEQYRALVENINEVIFTLDNSMVFDYISPVIERYLGYRAGDMTGKEISGFIHPDDVQITRAQISAAQQGCLDPCELRLVARDGSVHDIKCSLRLLFDGDTLSGITGIMSDVTQQKKMEQALSKAQNLADIGTLTAGIMHEINSPLQVITGTSESLLRRIARDEVDLGEFTKNLEMLNRNAWRIAEISRSLLNFARPSSGELIAEDVNDIVKDTLLLIEHQLVTWSNIQVRTELAESLPLIRCEQNKIVQVLINLLVNARDAVDNFGEITIRTSLNTEDDRVTIQVSDNGCGIPDDIQEKIFEPFFTTKTAGAGTGLGLAIITDIVRAHDGKVLLESGSGQDTTFTLSFPAVELGDQAGI